MTKVRGPLFSVEAHGNFGNTLVYQRRRGGAAVYRRVVPKNPNTTSQQKQRTSFAAAVSSWAGLASASKAWWTVKAWGMALTGYNLYLKNYLLGLGEEAPPEEPPEEPPTYYEMVIALGPVAYWRMGEVSGNLADSSGYSNTAVKYGSPTYGVTGAIADDSNKAVSLLNNVANYFRVANSASVNTGDIFSIVAWVKKAADGVGITIIGRDANGYSFVITAANLLQLEKTWVAAIVASTTTITGTGWHMVAATKTGATVKLYIDGVDRTGSVTNQTVSANGSDIDIGLSIHWGDYPWNGSLDEIAIFNTALSAADILALWETGSGA